MALGYPKSPLKSGPFLIYLTARSPERGAEAVRTLNQDPQLKKAKVLAEDGGDTTIKYHELDISQTQSIQNFRDFLKKEHPEGIDIVINNAGIAMQGFDANVVKTTLQTNYYGTLEANQDLLPLIRNGGRLVNVSSAAGKLNGYSDEITRAFRDAAKTDVPSVTALMEKFKSAVNNGNEKEAGFKSAAYAVSKAGETAFTKAIAMEENKRGHGVLVNACCRGYVKPLSWASFGNRADNMFQNCSYVNTDMTKGRGTKTIDEGAKTPVMLALEDIGGRSGEFWERESVSEW